MWKFTAKEINHKGRSWKSLPGIIPGVLTWLLGKVWELLIGTFHRMAFFLFMSLLLHGEQPFPHLSKSRIQSKSLDWILSQSTAAREDMDSASPLLCRSLNTLPCSPNPHSLWFHSSAGMRRLNEDKGTQHHLISGTYGVCWSQTHAWLRSLTGKGKVGMGDG